MDNIENNITVTINENEEPIRSAHSARSGNNSGRSGLPISVKLFWLWNLLFELAVGTAFLCIMFFLFRDDGSAVFVLGTLFACVHAAYSFSRFKQNYRRNGVRAWKFALLGFLPLLLTGAVMLLFYAISESSGFGSYFDFVAAVFGICFMCYSVMYGVLLTAALGFGYIGHLIKRKKS